MNFRGVILFVALLSCLSCELRADRAELASRPEEVSVVLKPTEAIFRETADTVVVEKETRIGPTAESDPWHKAQFVNEQKGWAGTYRSIYRTSDGGSKWERLPFQTRERSRISSFFFIDESRGWLAITSQVHNERYGLGNSSKVFSTKDGGDTWNEQADFPDEVRISEVSFLNANQGFAIGSRLIDQPANVGPPYEEVLVLSTADGGNVWTDLSAALKDELRTSDSGLSLHSLSATELLLLTANGRIVQTPDRGKTWKTIVKFKNDSSNGMSSPTAYFRLIFDPEKKVRVLGGSQGVEGYWGNLVVNGENNFWTSYELLRVPILDAVFLSKNEVLACGMETPAVDDKRSPATVGIILKSLDGGRSWGPVYRSKANETFISLTKAADKLYAISDTGTFLSFALKG